MKTTIGGQMFISMWTEKLVKAIPEIRFLQHNTKIRWCYKTLLTAGNSLELYINYNNYIDLTISSQASNNLEEGSSTILYRSTAYFKWEKQSIKV